MPTLANVLSQTSPVSSLVRKARRLGLRDIEEMIALAVHRGCKHYAPGTPSLRNPPSVGSLDNDELTILLITGENPYNPTAIRCAAQLARSPNINPKKLARIAIQQKTERVLAYLARAGREHDPEGAAFWEAILDALPPQTDAIEPDLPHWTRFVSMPGLQRNKTVPPRWLTPHP